MFARLYCLWLISLVTVGCTPCVYQYSKEGAEEFVLDSYKIQQGKFSILEMEGCETSCLPSYYLQEYEDQIDEDDLLLIALYHPSRADLMAMVDKVGHTTGYRVINGEIILPHLGKIAVKGLTLDEARVKIEQSYLKHIANVEIFIEYSERHHSTVALSGAVGVSQIPINGRVRLFEVLSKARIAPDANLFKSYVLRHNCALPVDLYKLIHLGDMSQNIVMRPQDKIFIANAPEANIMVLGEVGLAMAIPVPHGYISIREALAIAGGIPFTGDKRCIQVIRGSIVNPKIYQLSWKHIAFLPNSSLLLMAGDTLYISETPITKWNRFIDQLLPSSLLIDLGIKTRGLLH